MGVKNLANPELVEVLTPEFQRRNEPNFGWAEAISATLALPGIRGLWTGWNFDSSGDLPNSAPETFAHIMVANGNPVFNYDDPLAQFIKLDGTGDYFARADHADFDITGAETYVQAARRGVTVGGWYYFSDAAGAAEMMLGKWDPGANERSYLLSRVAAGAVQFNLSNDGTAVTALAHSDVPNEGGFFFAAGILDRSEDTIKVMVNNVIEEAATYANDIHSGAANVTIGATSTGASLLTGRVALQFICAAQVRDAAIRSYYQTTRTMFEVI